MECDSVSEDIFDENFQNYFWGSKPKKNKIFDEKISRPPPPQKKKKKKKMIDFPRGEKYPKMTITFYQKFSKNENKNHMFCLFRYSISSEKNWFC